MFFVLCLVITVPLSVAWKILPVPNHIYANDISGGLFKADIGKLSIGPYFVNNVHYNIRFLDFFKGKLSSDFNVKDSNLFAQGRLYHNFTYLGLNDSEFKIKLPWLMQMVPIPPHVPVTLDGDLHLDVVHFQQGKPYCNVLIGKAKVYDLTVMSFSDFALGDIFADLSCQDGNIVLSFDENNTLKLSGDVIFLANQATKVNIRFKPDEEISSLLGLVGLRKSKDGFFMINEQF